MRNFDRVVIVGVGLLGGSIGKAMRERGMAQQVVGVGRRAAALQAAQQAGAIDVVETELQSACDGADLVIICTPVQLVVDFVLECCRFAPEKSLITDVGSTKAGICQSLNDAGISNFCGSHPLAGSDKSGVFHATANLFVNRTVVVTPTEHTLPAQTERTREFWHSLGSRTVQMTPQEHDEAIATTSHLPHVVAAALAEFTPDSLLPLAATGWCDTTRVAAGSVDLWLQILEENREPVLSAMRHFSNSLQAWIEAIESNDRHEIETLLTAGKSKRDSVGN